jgi:hypothetical protein
VTLSGVEEGSELLLVEDERGGSEVSASLRLRAPRERGALR